MVPILCNLSPRLRQYEAQTSCRTPPQPIDLLQLRRYSTICKKRIKKELKMATNKSLYSPSDADSWNWLTNWTCFVLASGRFQTQQDMGHQLSLAVFKRSITSVGPVALGKSVRVTTIRWHFFQKPPQIRHLRQMPLFHQVLRTKRSIQALT